MIFSFPYFKSFAHTSLLIDVMYQTQDILIQENKKYSLSMTAQLMNIFDQFTSTNRKISIIDPKPLFNNLIQK